MIGYDIGLLILGLVFLIFGGDVDHLSRLKTYEILANKLDQLVGQVKMLLYLNTSIYSHSIIHL